MGAYRELLAQAKKANHTAIQKLYERYYTLLRSYSFVNQQSNVIVELTEI